MHDTHPGGLEVRGATKLYPGTQALADVDLTVRPGEVVALLGENGAGKSTLASIIGGVIQPTRGEMRWKGKPYSPADPREAFAAGIGLIHQELTLVPELSVAENVLVGQWPVRAGFVSRGEMRRRAGEALARLGYAGSLDRRVGSLSTAAQQQVEIAKSLMLDANLLILDEPTAALGAAETDALFDCIRSLQATGVSFIYVSHRLAEIAQIADRIVVLRDGRVISTHETGTVATDQLVEEMVGRPVERLFPAILPPSDREVIRVDGLSSRNGRFHDVGFTVHAGEILGIAGIIGSGRTELVRAIAGADDYAAGTVTYAGSTLPKGDSSSAIRAGLVLIPEDRKHQGLIVDATVEDNIALPNMDLISAHGWVRPRDVTAMAREVGQRVGLKGRPGQVARSLSGGNQQKLVIGKWLRREPGLVILDDPTRGIDVGARAAIYELVAQLAAQGSAIILVSSDLEEVLGLSHRVLVLSRGRVMGELSAQEATPSQVMALAVA